MGKKSHQEKETEVQPTWPATSGLTQPECRAASSLLVTSSHSRPF